MFFTCYVCPPIWRLGRRRSLYRNRSAYHSTPLLCRSCLIRLPQRQTLPPLQAQEIDFAWVITSVPVETWLCKDVHTHSNDDPWNDGTTALLRESQINRDETRIGIFSRVNGGLEVATTNVEGFVTVWRQDSLATSNSFWAV